MLFACTNITKQNHYIKPQTEYYRNGAHIIEENKLRWNLTLIKFKYEVLQWRLNF